MKLEYIVKEKNTYENIKQILKEEFLMSERFILKLKYNQHIFLNGCMTHINAKIYSKDIVTVLLDFEEDSPNIVPMKMNLNILYEDESLLIVNKPPFMPVHPSMDHFEDSLANGVKYYFYSIGLKRKIRPVNRLDKNTSGIVIFAKNEYVQECLIKQTKNNVFEKMYYAIVDGIIKKKEQIICEPIARKENSIIERCVCTNGNTAITKVELVTTYQNYSFIKCILKTGRTHQIRVHMQFIGHPILGDDLYGKKSDYINRQALHAYQIKLIHPITKQKLKITAELPNDMKKLL